MPDWEEVRRDLQTCLDGLSDEQLLDELRRVGAKDATPISAADGPDWPDVEDRLNRYLDEVSDEQFREDLKAAGVDVTPSVEGLGYDALAAAYDAGVRAAGPRLAQEAMAEGAGYLCSRYAREHAAGLDAVRDYVLRAIAGPVDVEGLGRILVDAERNIGGGPCWHEKDESERQEAVKEAEAVALAAVAPVALALLRAREVLQANRRDLSEFNEGCEHGLWNHHGFTLAVHEINTALDPLPAFVTETMEAHDAEVRAHDAAEIAVTRAMLQRCRRQLDGYRYILDDGHTTTRGGLAVEIEQVLSDPSPAARRIEAEARLGRAAVAISNFCRSAYPDSVDEVALLRDLRNERDAALAALRGMDESRRDTDG